MMQFSKFKLLISNGLNPNWIPREKVDYENGDRKNKWNQTEESWCIKRQFVMDFDTLPSWCARTVFRLNGQKETHLMLANTNTKRKTLSFAIIVPQDKLPFIQGKCMINCCFFFFLLSKILYIVLLYQYLIVQFQYCAVDWISSWLV